MGKENKMKERWVRTQEEILGRAVGEELPIEVKPKTRQHVHIVDRAPLPALDATKCPTPTAATMHAMDWLNPGAVLAFDICYSG